MEKVFILVDDGLLQKLWQYGTLKLF
jgi:hypothetical protein